MTKLQLQNCHLEAKKEIILWAYQAIFKMLQLYITLFNSTLTYSSISEQIVSAAASQSCVYYKKDFCDTLTFASVIPDLFQLLMLLERWMFSNSFQDEVEFS